MTSDQFRDLVGRMREAQRAYYRNPSRGALIAAKQLESAVDDALRDALAPPRPKLFDEAP